MRKIIESNIAEFMQKIEEMTNQINKLVTDGLFGEIEPVLIKRTQSIEDLFKSAATDKEAMALYARLLHERNSTLKQQIEAERELVRKGLSNIENVRKYTR
jgi:hypothetical protein